MNLIRSLAICIALLGTSAQAYDLSGKIGLGLGAGMTVPMAPKFFETQNDPSWAGSIWGRYHFNSRTGLELGYDRLDYKKTAAYSDLGALSFFYRFAGTDNFSWIMQVGAGSGRTPNYGRDKNDTWQVALKGKLGFEYMTSEYISWGLAANYDYFMKRDRLDKELHVIVPAVSMTVYFGGAPEKPAAPAPVAVNQDVDGDGINNDNDRCPNTPAGTKVSGYGCALDEKVSIKLEVRFATGKSVIDPEFDASLKELATFMTQFPETAVEIAGHTDSTGSAKKNMTISQQRADSVRNYLVQKLGIDETRLIAKGYGLTQPIDDNTTVEGRAKNRRVMAEITATKKGVN